MKVLTLDDGQSAPLDLLPAAVDQPFVDLLDQHRQVLRVGPHDLVKLCELESVRIVSNVSALFESLTVTLLSDVLVKTGLQSQQARF